MRFGRSLFSRLGATFLLLLLLVSGAGGAILHSLIRRDLVQTTRQKVLAASGTLQDDLAKLRQEVRLYSSLVARFTRTRIEEGRSADLEAALVEHSRSRSIRIDEYPSAGVPPPGMEFLTRSFAGVPTLDFILQGGGSGRLHVVGASPVDLRRGGERRVVTATSTLGRDFLVEEKAALGGEVAIYLQNELVVSTSTCASCLACTKEALFDEKNWRLLEGGKTLFLLLDCNPPQAVAAVPMRTFDGKTVVFTVTHDRAAETAALFHATVGVLAGCGILAVIVAATFFFVTRRTRRQLAELTRLAGEISGGRYGEVIPVTGKDEVGELAAAFNRMSVHLRDAVGEIADWNRTLEQRVEEKSGELERYHEGMVEVEKLAAIGQLAAGVAHELNNPLAGIMGYSELALELYAGKKAGELTDQDVERLLGWYRNIDDLSQRCRTIILDMLKFGRQSSEEREDTDVNALLEHTLSFVRKQLAEGNVEVVRRFVPGLPHVVGNPTQFQQVFTNLFLNGVQAMRGGGTLTVATSSSPGGVRVDVADTGVGIPPEALKRIFDPFYTTKPVGEGTGLGLSVSYGIVKRHGGDILVRSVPGEGSVFSVLIPFRPPAPAPDEVGEGTGPA